MHASLAHYYETIRTNGSDAAGQALLRHDELVRLACEADDQQAVNVLKEADLTRAMLEGYFDWLADTGSDAGLVVVAPETVIDVELEVRGVPVVIGGKLDVRVMVDGPMNEPEESLIDHKTVGEFTTPVRALGMDEQMKLYRWLLSRKTGHFVSAALYNMLRKVKRTANAKPPFYMRETVRHSMHEIMAFEKRLMGELSDMLRLREELDAGANPLEVAYPTPTRNCHWDCDFYTVCPFVDRPQDDMGAQILDTLYEEVDPYARYRDSSEV